MNNNDAGSRMDRGRSTRLRLVALLMTTALVGLLAVGCQHTRQPDLVPDPSAGAPGTVRIPLPLLPRMAEHQLENMRDHLAAVQEITAALSNGDFEGVGRAAARIRYSEQMGRMCERMGAGAPGFNQLALQFHRTADTIAAAANQHDTNATLKALAATLQTCVGCHAVYRHQIVNEATWERITRRAKQSNAE